MQFLKNKSNFSIPLEKIKKKVKINMNALSKIVPFV